MKVFAKLILLTCFHSLVLGVEKEHREQESVEAQLLEALKTGESFKVFRPSLQVVSPEAFGRDHPIEPIKFRVERGLSQILNIGPPKAISVEDALKSIEMFVVGANAGKAEPVLWLELADDANDTVLRKLLAQAALKGIKKVVLSVSKRDGQI